MISIVNYGMGNLGSVQNMLKKIGAKSKLISTPEEILQAEKLLLPGVGAFDAAMKKIAEFNFLEPLNEMALQRKIPTLGICLGMQLLTERSDEGQLQGLGWIPAETKSFKKVLNTQEFKVPHMGWSETFVSNDSKLTLGFKELEEIRFYYVHSYYVECKNNENSIMKSHYGVEFDSAIQRENIFGAQFHPEKSHKYGMKFLENFARI